MENFDWTAFRIKIAIKRDLKDLYHAWTTTEALEKWFLRTADFTDENDVELNKNQNYLKGDRYRWIWHLYEDEEKGMILDANGLDFVQFTFAGNCVVEVSLTQEFEYTIVTLSQKNIPLDEASKKNIRIGCHGGWSFYLVNLKSVYEGGLDLRNKDSRFKPMVNN